MQYRILGPLVVVSQNRQLPLGPLKDRTVLGVLLLHANEVVPRQRLIDELWGESPPPTAVKAVNGYVWQLRKALGSNGSSPIATRQPGYLIEVENGELDAQQFSTLHGEARARASSAEFEEASAIYSEALSLWRGRPLSGIELESVGRHELERLDEERIVALMGRIDCDLALGRHDDLVGELDVLVAEHPLRERLYAQQMLALYRSGRQADALRAYQQARTSLVDELALEPGPALQRLERGILNHDPSLQTPAGTAHRNGVETQAAPELPEEQRRPPGARRVLIGVALGLALAAGLVAAALAGRGAKRVALTSTGPAVLVVEPRTGEVDARIPLSRRPIAGASDGQSVWLAGSDGTVTRVAAVGSPKEETVQIGGAIGGIALGDRSVWVSAEDQGSIVRLDPATLKVVDRIAVGNGPTAVVFGVGAAWVANETDGTVSRVDSVRDVVTKTIPVGATPHALAFGAGSLWVADEQLGSVTRIDARTTLPVASIDVGSAPGPIAFGHGSLWVGDTQGGGVSRIDPQTDRVVSTTAVGATVDTLGVLPRDVWVGIGAGGTLTRLDVRDGRIGKPVRIGGAAVGVVQLGSRVAVASVGGSDRHRGGTLILAGNEDDATLDPATWWTMQGWMLLGATNDGLVASRRAGGVAGSLIVPDLARSLPIVDAAGTTYTFVLRRNLRYSTGRPVRARDVRASIERLWRIKQPQLHTSVLAVAADLRLGLLEEEQCVASPRDCDLRRAITGDDRSGSVTFHLAHANPSFLRLLTLPFYDLLPAGTPARDHRVLPATGPYRIASFVPGHRILLARNPQFEPRTGRPDGYPDHILWRLDSRADDAERDVLQGRLDHVFVNQPLAPAHVAELAIHHASQLRKRTTAVLVYLFLNTRIPPFNQLAVRRALSEAIDRRKIVHAAGGPLAVRSTCQIVPPGYAGYRPYCPYTTNANAAGAWLGPDLARARRQVARSHTAGTKVTVWAEDVPDDPTLPPVARYVASVLRSLGYRASVALVRGRTAEPYHTKVAAPATRAQIGISVWMPDFADNTAIFPPLLSCNVPRRANLAQFCDPALDRLVRRAGRLQATDQGAASSLWGAVDRRIVDDAPWVPLFDVRTAELVSRRLGNYTNNAQFGPLIDQAWVR